MKELNTLQRIRVRWWRYFNRDKHKMFTFSMDQGFKMLSSYHSARLANKDLINHIIKGKI